MFPGDWDYPYIILIWLSFMIFGGTAGLSICIGVALNSIRAFLVSEIVLFSMMFCWAYFYEGVGR